ncbi:DUF7507 domain-containing protein [Myroides pelagicus]|uniref:DUF7507 domain-containing protein n=1 Tax=Myroides pelagicus TaxID=270914 RepID=A0A7K1GLW6_9FLAO|nr:hypothetical protein [Myroides pelagicus]MTH29730.1 hypothetical protein [Myroides pelagicus]
MIYNLKRNIKKIALTLCVTLGVGAIAWADGSRTLYPSGVTGHRAMLLGKGFAAGESIPFANEGAHYVYAKEGETITLASSAQGTSSWIGAGADGGITLYSPSGVKVVNDNRTEGRIADRQLELAGPKLKKDSSNGYEPIRYLVPAGGEGIYRVEFTSRNNTEHGPVIEADNNWWQGNDAAIRAWDVSVINKAKNAFVEGRVYATNLNLTNGNFPSGNNYQNVEFNGQFYVRTNDGFTYRVKHNGTSGIVWSFFVNNKGFFDYNSKKPYYKSMNKQASEVIYNIHNPNAVDDASNITHKIYYSLPAKDMPKMAKVAVFSGNSRVETWLNPTVIEPEVTGVKIVGAEGTVGAFGHKGGYIEFDAPISGQQFTIDIVYNGTISKKLKGETVLGHNKVHWDGKDEQGKSLQGTIPVDVNVQLQGAEVHFPFFDIEYNMGGIAIELLDYRNESRIISDLVYWDDSDIEYFYYSGTWYNTPIGNKVNPIKNSHLTPGNKGISSNINGHKWGQGGSGAEGTFGDKKSMDTWTFRMGNKKELKTEVVIKQADLYTELKTTISGDSKKTTGHKGDRIKYVVTAGNNGPSDIIADTKNGIKGAPFTFTVPPGVDVVSPSSVKAVFNCRTENASESVALSYDPLTRTFRSELQLPNGCSVTYTIEGVLNGMTGSMIAESTILRPADVIDPDATNNDLGTLPTNPHYECYNNDSSNLPGGSGSIGCNNIQESVFMALGECVDEILYFEDFDRGFWNKNSGRTDWVKQPSISIGANGEILKNADGSIKRQGPKGGASSSYLFAPGINDVKYSSANYGHGEKASVARIKDGYYSVNPPGYVQMGIPTTDSWHNGLWVPNAESYDPNDPNSTYDWTPAWDTPGAIRDMSGAVNGSAFLIRGAASASQSIKPFYEFDVPGLIEKDRVYTLDIYSYVTYHDKDYMIMDVVDVENGHIYASVPLKYTGVGLPEGSNPTGFSLGWIPLSASFTFSEAECVDVMGRKVKIAIRGSQDRALETGKGFGHTLIDNITFSKRTQNNQCGINVSHITCADECYLDVVGKGFGWLYESGEKTNGTQVVEQIVQPATDGGFVVDLYRLDNSFNMVINGVPLHTEEFEFETGSAKRNVRFKSDKKRYGDGGVDSVWNINKHSNGIEDDNTHLDLVDRFNNPTPVIRVIIDKWGNVKLYGKRKTDANLEELEVFDTNTKSVVSLQSIHWISTGTAKDANVVDVTQNVIGQTMMYGFGYGQQAKECETLTLEKEGAFIDESKDGYAQIGESIQYAFKVKNLGDMEVHDLEIVDPLFGFNIKLDQVTHQPIQSGVSLSGDLNNNGILDRNETWTFTVLYNVTSEDIYNNKGVYNRAIVKAVGKLPNSQREIEVLSIDPTPYKEGDEGWDANRAQHTFVPLKADGLLLTNPMIYQKMQ